jgi:predicted TIM-barrel fold metal-dependent hydrolase
VPDFPIFDADNHYYEALDAFTRHIEPAMRKRAMQWATVEGKQRLLVGGKVNKFIPNPTFDPVSKPGAMADYFRGKAGVSDLKSAFGDLEPIDTRPEYRDRDARLALMDTQGIEAAIMLPTLGVGMEVALEHDLPAAMAAFRAFNRWLDEDWGFNYHDRIYAAPYFMLTDVDWAVEELAFALARDARTVLMRPGPALLANARTTPGDRRHDRFWARLEESGITLVLHGGDYGYQPYYEMWGITDEMESFVIPLLKRLLSASAIRDTIASFLSDRLFDRFPGLRVATIETGSEWVAPLLKKLKALAVQLPGEFGRDPYEQFMEHVWVSPFFEDDVPALVDVVGADRVVFGSDYPHVEGLAEPASFEKELSNLDPVEIKKIMYDNARGLVTPQRA